MAGAFGVGDSVLKATHAQFSLLVSCCSFWHLCLQAGDCVSLEAEVQAASSKLSKSGDLRGQIAEGAASTG